LAIIKPTGAHGENNSSDAADELSSDEIGVFKKQNKYVIGYDGGTVASRRHI
jgi:hypothetical protein